MIRLRSAIFFMVIAFALGGLATVAWLGGGTSQPDLPDNAAVSAKPSPDYPHKSISELFRKADIHEMGPHTGARDFELKSLSGETVRLRQFRGKTVIVNFWTTW